MLTLRPVLYNKKHPVPNVHLAWPAKKHIWPISAACWSPMHYNNILNNNNKKKIENACSV